MNSVPYSDSEQCTESKLSLVYSAHTWPSLRSQCAGLPVSRLVAACLKVVSRLCPAVSWPCCRLAPAVSWPPSRSCAAHRIGPCRAPTRLCCNTLLPYRSLYGCPYCDTRATRPTPSHDTNHCITTYPRPGLLVRPDLLVRPGHACHDTTQCIVTQPPNGQ